MSNLAYKEIIDSVGEFFYNDVDDIIAKGGRIITGKNGTQLGIFNGGKALNSVSGVGKPLSTTTGLSAITKNSVVSTILSKLPTGITTKAIGVSALFSKAAIGFGIGYAGGIALGEALNDTEEGREFLIDYYNFFTNSDNAVDDDKIAGFVDSNGISYVDAKSVNSAFDYLYSSGAYGKTIGKQNIEIGKFEKDKLTFDKDVVFNYTFEALTISQTLNERQKNLLNNFKTFIENYDIEYSLDNTFAQYTLTFYKDNDDVRTIWLDIEIWNINEIVFPEGVTKYPSSDPRNNIIEFEVHSSGTKKRIIRFTYSDNIMYLQYDIIRDFEGFEDVRNYIPPIDDNNYVEIVNYGFETETQQGITILPNAKIPNKTGTLEERFPDWWSKKIDVTLPDDSIVSYVPLTIPNSDNLSNVQVVPQTEAQEGIINDNNEDIVTESTVTATETAIDNGVDIPTNNPKDNTGNTPVIVPPVGVNRTGFINIYMPTKDDLQNFNNELWSVNPIDAIGRLFQNPMDAIIGLHQIYAPAPLVSKENIKVGLLVSKVITSLCEEQYVSLDFGSMTINEYFGNVLDYSPYTTITLYLPFIGFVDLRTEDVMQSIINLKYNIDLLTGSCVAIINVKRENMNADLYTFNGNCAIQLPITGANYSGILSTILSAGLAIATKGATASLGALGVMSSVAHGVNIPITHGNSATSNYGAMSGKTPFIIINRQSDVSAYNFNKFYGYASSETTKLSKLSGYTKVKDVHVDNINNATDDELNMIYELLTGGIII